MSIVTLFYNCLIEPNKNFILDDANGDSMMTMYLSTLSQSTILDFQYVKHALAIDIKIDKSQANLEMGVAGKDMNYCRIMNTHERTYYYFIVGKEWKSQNTILLHLAMDTLNTFRYDTDYSINAKTFVRRMHKDRFSKDYNEEYIEWSRTWRTPSIAGTSLVLTRIYRNCILDVASPSNLSVTIDSDNTTAPNASIFNYGYSASNKGIIIVMRYDGEALKSNTISVTIRCKFNLLEKSIDMKGEGINASLFKSYDKTLYENAGEKRIDWKLYYKNSDSADENSPVDCFLIPSVPVEITYPTDERKITASDITAGKQMYIMSTYNKPEGVPALDYKLYVKFGTNITFACEWTGEMLNYIVLTINDLDNTKIDIWMMSDGSGLPRLMGTYSELYILSNVESLYVYEQDLPITTYALMWSGNVWNPDKVSLKQLTYPAQQHTLLEPTIDKTLSTNIKLIDIPYCASLVTFDSNDRLNVIYPWFHYKDSDSKDWLKLTNLDTRFSNIVESDEENLLTEYLQETESTLNSTMNRFLKDPKLLHSDFYRYKFVYDSFVKEFPLELLDDDAMFENDLGRHFRFEFVPSRSVASKFLFKFIQSIFKVSQEDYDNILAVARNNEEVLYNSAYINYLRNGYNYDVKSKERNELMLGMGVLASGVGLTGSAIGVATTGNPMAMIGVAGSGISFVSSLMNYTRQIAQGEDNLARKLQETKAQAVSVLNADDVDLLHEYSENKAKIVKYSVSSQMEEVLDDLFYYCGYSVERQMKPDTHTRRNFNFVQADLVIDATRNLNGDIVDDIIYKFSNGVTFLHSDTGLANRLDFAQTKENLETSIEERY